MEKKQNSARSVLQYAKALLIGTAASLITGMILVLLCSVLMSQVDLAPVVVSSLSFVIVAAAVLIGGLLAAKIVGSRGALVGAACGATVFLLSLVISFMFYPEFTMSTATLIKLILCVLFGAVGGILGVNLKRKRK